jgi:hypothetical protein
MDNDKARARVKVSLWEESRGIKRVDLFPDFISGGRTVDIVPRTTYSVSEYLRNVLAPVSCPQCNAKKMNLHVAGGLKERFLKIAGRRVFVCPECRKKQVLKVHRCEWEIVGTAMAVSVVLLFFSIQWIVR